MASPRARFGWRQSIKLSSEVLLRLLGCQPSLDVRCSVALLLADVPQQQLDKEVCSAGVGGSRASSPVQREHRRRPNIHCHGQHLLPCSAALGTHSTGASLSTLPAHHPPTHPPPPPACPHLSPQGWPPTGWSSSRAWPSRCRCQRSGRPRAAPAGGEGRSRKRGVAAVLAAAAVLQQLCSCPALPGSWCAKKLTAQTCAAACTPQRTPPPSPPRTHLCGREAEVAHQRLQPQALVAHVHKHVVAAVEGAEGQVGLQLVLWAAAAAGGHRGRTEMVGWHAGTVTTKSTACCHAIPNQGHTTPPSTPPHGYHTPPPGWPRTCTVMASSSSTS